jgi:hypothetical protein
MTLGSESVPEKSCSAEEIERLLKVADEEAAEAPISPLIKHRQSEGIGMRGRFIFDPQHREDQSAMWGDLPDQVSAPKPGFPLVVRPAASANITEYGKVARGLLDHRLRSSGAILFRGLPIDNPSDFSKFMVGVDYPAMHTHGASERVKIAELVYGASDDVPASFTLHPHNEQAYLAANENPSYPRKLFFCCTTEPLDGAGGETPIVDNMLATKTLEKVAPALLAKFKAHGVRYDSFHGWGEIDAPMELNLGGECMVYAVSSSAAHWGRDLYTLIDQSCLCTHIKRRNCLSSASH